MARATDRASRMHLEDVKDQIAKILDPKFTQPAPTTSTLPIIIGRFDEDEDLRNSLYCWPDYSIRVRQ
jgi:hypothetical protein